MNPFSFPTAEDEAEKEERFLAAKDEQLLAKTKNLSTVERQLANDKQFLDLLGEEPPQEPGRGFLPTLLDTLDTPHQMVQGALARGLGLKDYQDLGVWDAARLGAQQDLRTADVLRRAGYLHGKPVLRGAVGFLGDIVTDPLQWISLFPQKASIAGNAFGEKLFPTMFGEESGAQIFKRVQDARLKTAMGAIEKAKEANPGMPVEALKLLEGQAGIKAEEEARALFEGALAVKARTKDWARKGIDKLAPEAISKVAAEDATRLGIGAADESLLGLKSAEDLRQLWKPKTIRFTSPLVGIPGIDKLPIIGAREADIPIVSDAVAKIHEFMGDAYYGTKLKVRDWLGEALAADANVSKTTKALAGFLDSASNKVDSAVGWTADKIGGRLSRRIRASGKWLGARLPAEQIMQHERDRDYLRQLTLINSAAHARDVLQLPDADDVMRQITRAMDALAENPAGDLAAELAKRIQDPQKLAMATKFGSHIQKRYAELAVKDAEAGLLATALDAYIPHIYDPSGYTGDWDTFVAGVKGKAMQGLGDGSVNFAKPRKYVTLMEAKANGLKPQENALALLWAREYASRFAHAQKDFAERMAYQHGVPKPIYDALTKTAREGSALRRRAALQGLADLGVINVKDVEVPALQLANGTKIDGELWDTLADIATNGNTASKSYEDMLEQTAHLRGGLEPKVYFADANNRQLAEGAYKEYLQSQQMIPGYQGESTFARAGATTIRPWLKERMLKGIKGEDEVFWNNLVPNHLAQALEESYYTGDSLKRWVATNSKGRAKNGYVEALDGTLGFLGKVNRVLKQGALSIWPARYTRDLMSAGFQSGLTMSPIEQVMAAGKNLAQLPIEGAKLALGGKAEELGQFLNLHSITQAHDIINGGKDAIDIYKRTIPNQQLMLEAMKAGFEWNGNYSTDLVATYGDMLEKLTESPAVRAAIPGLPKGLGLAEKTAWQKGLGWAAKRAKLPLEDKFWQRFPDFAERLERYGRTHTFLNLRIRGFDAQEAAALANRMHVDYKYAKTPFERRTLNNIFFFYSFSRGNATSLMQQLMQKPGALTTQLHAFHAAGEMLKDPNAYVDDPDAEEKVRSSRLAESLSMYLGRNEKTGLPRFLSSSGLPVEDIAKWGAVTMPNTLSTRDVIRAGADTALRTTKLVGAQANPMIRAALETLTGRSLFYDRPLTDETLRKIPKWEKDTSILARYPFRAVPQGVWEGLDEVTKKVLDARDNGDGTWTVNPYHLSILTVVAPGLSALAPANPVFGALSPLKYSSRFLSTRRMLTEPGVSDRDKWLRAMTGVHVDEIDPDASRLYDEKRDVEKYMDYLGIPKSKRRRMQMLQAETEDEE